MIKLGVIGMSDGNGHPYSWSAIFNGYDRKTMEQCPFPAIPQYLAKQDFPRDAIAEAKVTHIWTQQREISEHVAKSAFIPNIVGSFTEMLGEVDGVLLARDDAESHLEYAKPFLEAGIPIYIDKPLALSVKDAQRLINLQQYPGQLFSCSALRYANELQLSETDLQNIGRLRHIHATVPKSWNKYAVHVLEPVSLLSRDQGTIESTSVIRSDDSVTLAVSYSSGLCLLISALGASNAPIAISVIGDNSWKNMIFQDAFSAFKLALNDFVQGVLRRDVRIDTADMLNVVEMIEFGRMQ